MAALLDDAPGLDHADQIGPANGAEAVGDDNGGAAYQQPLQGFLDQRLGHGIYTGGGLVQNQQARVGQESAGDADQPALADGQISSRVVKIAVWFCSSAESERERRPKYRAR